jgi:hypothetical protein
MVLKIERVSDGQSITLHLSGRLRSEHVEQLKTQMAGSSQKIILDLDEVKLVDRDMVCFLGECEANGVLINRCSRYIRDWIDRERRSPGRCELRKD